MNWTHPAERRLVAMTDQTVVISSQAAAVPASRSCDRVASQLSALNLAPTQSANCPSAHDRSRE
jgi:hypothetical protein